MIIIKWLFFLWIVSFNFCHGKDHNKQYTSNKIAAGKTAGIWDYPFVGAMEYLKKFRCTAVMITLSWLLMPGNCLSKQEADLAHQKGEIRLGATYKETGGSTFPVNQVIVHSFYPKWQDCNLALTELAASVPRSDIINTIPIFHPNNDNTNIFAYSISVLGVGDEKEGKRGFGLKKAWMTIIHNQECADELRKVSQLRYNISEYLFCAKTASGSTCAGDEGGPALLKRWNVVRTTTYLLGIMIEKIGKCQLFSGPSIFIRISMFYFWIKNVIQDYTGKRGGQRYKNT